LRGPPLAATLHHWRRAGRPITLPIRRCRQNQQCFAADLPPDTGDAEWITLVVTLGFGWGNSVEDVASIQVGNREVPLLLASRTDRGAIFVTEKFTLPTGAETAVFEARKELLRRRHFRIELRHWRKAAGQGVP